MNTEPSNSIMWPTAGAKEHYPLGALIYINGIPMKIIKVEDDDTFGFRVILEETDQIQGIRKLGALFTQTREAKK